MKTSTFLESFLAAAPDAPQADEARRMIDEGVVQEASDIDLSMMFGAGLPSPYGGILPMLDREGVSQKVTGERFLPPGVASAGN